MSKQRRNYTAEEKVAIIRRHLLDRVAVSDLCDENQLNPNLYYCWQKEFFEGGAAAFALEGSRWKSQSTQRPATALFLASGVGEKRDQGICS